MKKFIFGIVIFFVSLVVFFAVAVKSPYVIKSVIDKFAPDYNITYSNISGNIFTGIQIEGLKFHEMNISTKLRFSWNPSKILYRHIAIDEVVIDDVDVETVKALVASLSTDENNNSSSGSFPLVVTVDKVHISLKPFTEYGIYVKQSVLNAEDIMYETDSIEVGGIDIDVDSNISKIHLSAALKDGILKIHSIDSQHIDSEALEKMFATTDENKTPKADKKEDNEPLNPLIPQIVEIEEFNATLKPRKYSGISIDGLHLKASGLYADMVKIVENKTSALAVKDCRIDLQSNVGQVEVEGSLVDNIVMLKDINANKIDTVRMKTIFVSDKNISNHASEMNNSLPGYENAAVEHETVQANTAEKKSNTLIPEKVVIEAFHADVLPAIYKPVHIHHLAVDAGNLVLNVAKNVIEKGELKLSAATNLSHIREHSIIRNNHLDGHVVLTPNKPFFKMYAPTIRKEAIGDINIDFNASKEKIIFDLSAQAKHLFGIKADLNASDVNRTEVFNIDINHLKVKGTYWVANKKVDIHSHVLAKTPIVKSVTLTADFMMSDKKMHYHGDLEAKDIMLPDGKRLEPLNNLHIAFKGNEKSLKTNISSRGLKGYFNVADFEKRGLFHLETKQAINMAYLVALPTELNATKVNAVIDVPLNFARLLPIKGNTKITSNVANVTADLVYGDHTRLKAMMIVPENSLLKDLDERIQWHAVSPLKLDFKMNETDISVSAKSNKLAALVKMKPLEGKVSGDIQLAGITTTLDGAIPGNIVIHSKVGSFHTLMNTIKSFYAIEHLPKMDGKLNLSLIVSEQKEVYLSVLSPEIIYHADRTTTHKMDDISIILKKSGDNVELSSYHLIYNDMTFYSSRPSVVEFNEETIVIPQLWLNDQLKITGKLNTKTMQGKIDAKAPIFHFIHEWIDLDTNVNIETIFDGNSSTDMKGKITLLDGNIHYNLNTKTFPNDSDIVITQDMKQDQNSTFMDHLSMLINIDSKKPLRYKEDPINVNAMVNLVVHKVPYSDPMLIGSIDILDGSSYAFQGKIFKLEHSHIYFTGDLTKPILDLTLKYKALKHVITIVITGTPTMPNILFSSVPQLSREQILSLILFDSEEAADTSDANDMMKMMGGAMAKAALNDLGVKIDHLVIGEGNSVEVGKKLTDKTTVIYISGEVPKMELRYEYNPNVEVIVGASEKSESIDVVYRKDFNLKKRDSDIVIKGR